MNELKKVTTNGIIYTFFRKKVKNINLRVHGDGTVVVSAPMRCSMAQIEAFVDKKEKWIVCAQLRAQNIAPQDVVAPTVTPTEAMALFQAVSAEIFPLFAGALHGEMPLLKVRDMKTRWGVCAPAKRCITLNLRLAERPREAVEYVILHEYAHFVRADHSPHFWAVVERYMPDYKQRKALLRNR